MGWAARLTRLRAGSHGELESPETSWFSVCLFTAPSFVGGGAFPSWLPNSGCTRGRPGDGSQPSGMPGCWSEWSIRSANSTPPFDGRRREPGATLATGADDERRDAAATFRPAAARRLRSLRRAPGDRDSLRPRWRKPPGVRRAGMRPGSAVLSFPGRLLASVWVQIAAFCVLVYFSDAPFGVTTACVVAIIFSERFASDA